MATTEPSDGDLLASGAAPDFGRFYDRHVDAVLAFVGGRAREPEAMFDFAAETFARAFEHRKQYDPARGPAIGWLLGIARNLIIDAGRHGQIEATSRERLGMAPVELDDEQLAIVGDRRRSAVLGAGRAKASLAWPGGVAREPGGTAMRDPFAILRDELVSAAARAPVVSRRRRRGWLRWRSHPVAIVIGALVVSGSATAAVISLNASSSQPLSGNIPGTIEPASLAGYRYTITVTPNLEAGSAFWNAGIAYSNKHGVGYGGGGGGGPYASASNPVFGGDGIGYSLGSEEARRHGDTVGYVLTSPAVAAVRVGARTIRTFSSPDLPAGDRAAVFFLPAGSPLLTVGWRRGDPIRSYMEFPRGPGSEGPTKIPTLAALPLDRYGNVIPTRSTALYGSFASFWQAPSAVTPNIQEPPYHGPTHPLPGVCELAQHGSPALRPEWGHTISAVSPANDSIGELFLSCLDTEYYLHGWPLQVGVLVDARRPGHVLGLIPGATPVLGYPGTVDSAGGSLTARRIGNAWLVVQGGSGVAQRMQVLGALRISKLDLHRLTPGLTQ
jgi:hypothetical protein